MYSAMTGWESPLLSHASKGAITKQLEPFFAFLPASLRGMLLRQMSVQVALPSPSLPESSKDEAASATGMPDDHKSSGIGQEGGQDGCGCHGQKQGQGHEQGHEQGQEQGQGHNDAQAHGQTQGQENEKAGYRLTISMEGARIVAMAFGVELRDAYLFCMANGLWPLRFVRNAGSLTLAEQEYLLRSRVTIVGCGALGGFVSMLLARVGIGSLVLCDDDVFEESNLNRQFFCDEKTIGRPKVDVAQENLGKIASHLLITPFAQRATKENLPHMLTGSHLMVDCVDSVATRIMLDEAAVALKIPYVHGALAGFEGFCGVSFVTEGFGLVRQMYGDAPLNDDAKVIQEVGLLAPTASSVASLQALLTVQTLLASFHGKSIPPKRLIHLDLLVPSLTLFNI